MENNAFESEKSLIESLLDVTLGERLTELPKGCIVPKTLKDFAEMHKAFPTLVFNTYSIDDYTSAPVAKVTERDLAVLDTLNIQYRKI